MRSDQSGLVDALPGLVWTVLADGQAEFVNRRWCEYTGQSLEGALGHGWKDTIHAGDLADFRTAWNNIQHSGAAGEIEVRLRRFDGEHRWFVFRFARMADEAGHPARWCGLAADADDRRSGDAPDGRLRRFVDSLPTQVIFLTPSGELEFVNREALRYFGVSLDELKNWAVSNVIHPEDLPTVFKLLQGTLTRGDPYDAHHRMLRGDGVYRWIRSRMLPSRDAHGNIVRYCSIQTDVDDLKRADALLGGEVRVLEMVARGHELPDVLRGLCRLAEDIADGCSCSILLLEPNGTRFRMGAGPSLPESYNTLLDGLLVDPNYGPCGLAVTSKAPVISAEITNDPRWSSSEWPALAGQHGLASCWSMPIRSRREEVLGIFALYRRNPGAPTEGEQELIGRFAHIAGIAIERAHADAALRASEAELRRAHSHLTEAQRLSRTGSFTWDVYADEHTWSGEIYRIFGFEPGVRVTMPMIQAAIHPEDMPAVESVLGGAAQGAEDFELVFRVVASGGQVRHAHVVGHRSEQITDRPVFLGALCDITESKVAEEALNRARAELAHVTRVMTLGALTASIAHEVNQPLTGIITNASTSLLMLDSNPPNVAGARATAQRILRDGKRASEVIQHLRDLFARKQPTTAPLDLNAAAREVLALSASELHRSRVVLRTDFEDALPMVRGDRVQLQQVILNLILNASDAMREVNDRPRTLLVATRCDDVNGVRLWVSDSGIGIDPRNVEQLFNAFYTTKSHGMGVGLSISRSIIESHEGRLWAAPNEGPGATFSFSIPPEPARVMGAARTGS
jgi:PAS domain S-box-containing protein